MANRIKKIWNYDADALIVSNIDKKIGKFSIIYYIIFYYSSRKMLFDFRKLLYLKYYSVCIINYRSTRSNLK